MAQLLRSDDVLGWPLQPLEGGYRELVRDHSIDAGGLLESWNWLSHLRYREDRAVLDEATGQLRRALAHRGTTPPLVPLGAPATAEDL